jgi:hypothetical protein
MKMKEQIFQSEEQMLAAITESWNEVIFEAFREFSIVGWNA